MKKEQSLKKYALISATMAAFLTPFMASAINLAIPSIGGQFQTSAVMLGWVVTSYLLASAAFLVPTGRLGDIIGRKKVFVTGIAVFGIFSFLCGLAGSIGALILYRILQGIGSAMIFGTNIAILTSVYPPQERGKVLGVNVAAVYIGLSMGPVLGGFLTHRFGWPAIFYFSTILAVIAFIIILFELNGEWHGIQGEQYDTMGAVLYTLGLIGFMYGLSSLSNNHGAKYILVLGLLILGFFIYYENRMKNPLLDMKLFATNITFAFSNLAALINYSATFAVTFLLSLYLQSVRGYDSQTAGLIMLTQPVVMALLSPLAGTLSDRIEPRKVASLGMGISAFSLFLFWFIGAETPIPLVMGNLLFLGAGFALFSSPNTNAVMGSVRKEVYGLASSTIGTMRLVGQAVSMAVVTLMIAIYIGNIELEFATVDALVKTTRVSFIIFTIMCFVGVFASLARGNFKAVEEK